MMQSNGDEQKPDTQQNQGTNDAPIQVEYNKYIWVYEDPATDTFSSPSAILFGKQNQKTKRLRSYSAPQDMGYNTTNPDKPQVIAKHVVKRRRIASITSCGEPNNEDYDSSSSPSKMDIDYLVD